MRLAPTSIVRSFQNSDRRHLLLTGSRGSGKSTLAGQIAALLAEDTKTPLPGFVTTAMPKEAVVMEENLTGRRAVIGTYEKPQTQEECASFRMRPVSSGLEGFARETVEHLFCSDTDWVSLDELGYIESGCAPFLGAVRSLFEKKRVLAVVRKQHTPFLDELRARPDVFVFDLDAPLLPLGAVIMASGYGRRFGGNKLLVRLDGRTLIEHALDHTEGIFARRVVVTRYEEVEAICGVQCVDCVRHTFPERNDTVRIGVEYLQNVPWEQEGPAGYLFCPADQPLLSRETIETLALSYSQLARTDSIFRLAFEGREAAPVLFGADYGEQLKELPHGAGGSWLIRQKPAHVHLVEAACAWELADIDTPEDLARIQKICGGRSYAT